jgi:hypothetical protein
MPVSDGLSMEYLSNLKNISSAFAPVDSNAMATLTGENGALANSLGFGGSTGVSLSGLTPEQVTGVVNNRSTLLNQDMGAIEGMIKLRDMVTGGKENRDALRQASRDIFTAKKQSELNDNNHIFEQGLTDQKLGEDWKQLQAQITATKAIHDSGNTTQLKMHSDTMALGRAKLKLEERRQKVIEDAMATNPTATQEAFPASPDMFAKFEKEKEAYSKKTGMFGEGGDRKNYAMSHLRQQALGTKYGTIFSAGTFKDELGYDRLRLAPTGWYGMIKDPKTGAITYSSTPVVPLNPTMVPTKDKTKTATAYPVYSEE